MRIVEFVGLPGAGKTTVATALANRLDSDGVGVATRPDVEAHQMRAIGEGGRSRNVAAWLHFGTANAALALQVASFSRRLRPVNASGLRAAKRLLGAARTLTTAHRWSTPDVVLLDEGMARQVWSATVEHKPLVSGEVQRLFKGTYRDAPVAFVHVDADPEVAAQRIYDRPSRPGKADPWDLHVGSWTLEEAHAVMENYGHVLRRTIFSAILDLGLPCITIDACGELDENANRLHDWLASAPAPSFVPDNDRGTREQRETPLVVPARPRAPPAAAASSSVS